MLTPPDHVGEPPAPIPYDRAEQEKRLRSAERALALLGKINPLALEEFAALEERHKFLSDQLEDLKASRRDLLTVVKDVDERVQQIFQAAYEDVEREFEKVFAVLFPGGSGRLVLTDPDNWLETGIEVEARPPGKKVKRLSLLSGGERSLTAVAFLVAIFRARPSPFYVLDEVEAALDDRNLSRLVDLLADLKSTSQLIIITHQKRTMEVADALYGVSMRGDGITQVISQRLREHEPRLAQLVDCDVHGLSRALRDRRTSQSTGLVLDGSSWSSSFSASFSAPSSLPPSLGSCARRLGGELRASQRPEIAASSQTQTIETAPPEAPEQLAPTLPAVETAPPEPALDVPPPSAGRMVRLRSRLARSQSGFGRGLLTLLARDTIDDDTWDEVEETLLTADVGVAATRQIVDNLRTQVKVMGARTPDQVRTMLRDQLLVAIDQNLDRTLRTQRHDEDSVDGGGPAGRRTGCGGQRDRQDDDLRQARPRARR